MEFKKRFTIWVKGGCCDYSPRAPNIKDGYSVSNIGWFHSYLLL